MAEPAAEPGQAGLLSRAQAEVHYDEAVAEAVLACAEDTAGQRCYICFGEGDEDEGLVLGCACRLDNGFAHVSCLARGAQAAVERDADTGWARWYICGLCEQEYHGVVRCALGWACWKTYVGRPEDNDVRRWAMSVLGGGLHATDNYEDALSVIEAELSMMRRRGAPEKVMLVTQNNLANCYDMLGRHEEGLNLYRDAYSGCLRLNGEDHRGTVTAASNLGYSLFALQHHAEAKALLRKTIPVARRIVGEGNNETLKMRWAYAVALYRDAAVTEDDLREAVGILEEIEPTARRVLGAVHPTAVDIERSLRLVRRAIAAGEAAARPEPGDA